MDDPADTGGNEPGADSSRLARMLDDEPIEETPASAPPAGPAPGYTATEQPPSSTGSSRLPRVLSGAAGMVRGRRRAAGVIVGIVVVAAVVLGAGRMLLTAAGPSPSPSTAGGPLVSASISGAASSSAGSPTGITPSQTPELGASASLESTQSLPAQKAPTAKITFNELVLDPSLNAQAKPRSFSFVSDGPGLVSVEIVASAPTDSTKVCLSGDGGLPTCASGATPSVSFYSQSSQSRWTATLVSANEGSPTIDVALSWPSNKAAVTVAHAPFEGAPNRDSLRSLVATVQARSNGSLTVEASWAPSVLASSLTVSEVRSSGPVAIDHTSFNAASSIPPHSTNVRAGTSYRLTLMNQSPAGTPPDLTATISFP